MDRALQQELENYFEMFRSAGWKQLVEELQANIVHINSVELTKDEQDLFFRKGQLSTLKQIINLQFQIELQQEELDAAV